MIDGIDKSHAQFLSIDTDIRLDQFFLSKKRISSGDSNCLAEFTQSHTATFLYR
jgi:hypothetical protein